MRSKKLAIFLVIFILQALPLFAVVRYSQSTIIDYKKYFSLTSQYPNSKYYHFEFAMVLASMGKIEAAGKEFSKINDLDDTYPKKIIKYLESQATQYPSWKNHFKLGFCYYFIFDDLNGRLELAERRVKRAKEKGEKEKVKAQKNIIAEVAPQANYYYQRAIISFQKVIEKRPLNDITALAYAYQAVIKSKIHSWDEAKNLCEKALALSPDAYAIRAAYAETLRQTGNMLGATGQLSTAYKLKEAQATYEKETFGNAYLE